MQQPTAPRVRDTEHWQTHGIKNTTKKSNITLFLSRIAKLKQTQHKTPTHNGSNSDLNSRLSHDQMHFLYQQLLICSCDTDNNVKTLYFCFRELLRDCFKRTNSIETSLTEQVFGTRTYSGQKMLEKYCYALSFEKELFLKVTPYPFL